MVAPDGRWLGGLSPRRRFEDGDHEAIDARSARALARVARQRELQEILGAPVFFDAVDLTGLKPRSERCVVEGQAVSWSVWAPHRKLLVDVFARVTPEAEVEAKNGWAQARGLVYAVVPPGNALTMDDLRSLAARGAEGR